MKKSDSLAVANAERIAHQLRQERNDYQSMAYEKRLLLDQAMTVIGQLRQYVPDDAKLEDGKDAHQEIDGLMERAKS